MGSPRLLAALLFASAAALGASRATVLARLAAAGLMAVAVVATIVFCGVGSWILLKITDAIVGLRVSAEQEREEPEQDQQELVELAREIEARRAGIYELDEDEKTAIEMADAVIAVSHETKIDILRLMHNERIIIARIIKRAQHHLRIARGQGDFDW